MGEVLTDAEAASRVCVDVTTGLLNEVLVISRIAGNKRTEWEVPSIQDALRTAGQKNNRGQFNSLMATQSWWASVGAEVVYGAWTFADLVWYGVRVWSVK